MSFIHSRRHATKRALLLALAVAAPFIATAAAAADEFPSKPLRVVVP